MQALYMNYDNIGDVLVVALRQIKFRVLLKMSVTFQVVYLLTEKMKES